MKDKDHAEKGGRRRLLLPTDGCECRVLIKSHLGTMGFSYLEPALHKAQLVLREDSPLLFFFLLTHFLGFVAMSGTLLNPLEYIL